jgi:ComF family protein
MSTSLASLGRAAFSELIDFLLPPVCPLCRTQPPTRGGLCAACADATGLEPSWREGGEPLACAGAAAPYAGKAEEMIKGLKYAGRLSLAAPLGHLLAAAIEGRGRCCDLLAPVPLHPRRLAERGFNQSLLLARELARQAGLAVQIVPRLLARIRYTRPQVELAGSEREVNVRGAFAVAEAAGLLEGRSVLLIDDVFTTGATLKECAAALRRAGAARVLALTVARTN